MKDIIENRSRLSASTKARLMMMSLRENGLLWTGLLGIYYATSAIGDKAFAIAAGLRSRRSLPGMNSVAMNKVIWENWDWSAKGEEWSPSPEWKQSVIRTFLTPNIPLGATIIEVGPGGGRWTGELLARASQLIGIDISASCVRECQQRFAGCSNAEFRVGSGADLAGVPTSSADIIWSFDVFVHINRPQFEAYAREFARVLKPGGAGIVHHGSVGGANGGWRSDVVTEDVERFLTSAGLRIRTQLASWSDGNEEYEAGLYGDLVTVFEKPSSAS